MADKLAFRVLMLLENSYYPRDTRVRREAESLARAGHEVTVICPALKTERRREIVKGVRVWRYAVPPEGKGVVGYVLEYGYSMAVTLLLTLKLAMQHGVDVIHAANPPDLFVFVAALFKPWGVRFIYDQHDLAPEMYRARYGERRSGAVEAILRACESFSYLVADHVIVTNASYRETAMKRGKVPSERITIVRNGPDEAQLDYHAEAHTGLAPAGVKIIAYLGLMGIQDGVDHLIYALDRLRRDLGREDFRCLLMGSGEEKPRLEQLTHRLGLDSYVCFTGFIPDPEYIPYILAADTVMRQPSSEYNDRSTMVKIMDYMTLGKPIVAFDLKETRRSAGEAALYARPNDVVDFAKMLAHLMDHPEQRYAIGKLGRSRVEGELSWACSAESLLRAYRGLVVGHRNTAVTGSPSPSEQGK